MNTIDYLLVTVLIGYSVYIIYNVFYNFRIKSAGYNENANLFNIFNAQKELYLLQRDLINKNIATEKMIQSDRNYIREQLESLNKNSFVMNEIYELQKREKVNIPIESSDLYQGIQNLMKELYESSEYTEKYRDQIYKLNENLKALNSVYENMLAAMNVKK